MRMKRLNRMGRPACEGRHVEAVAEADSCGMEDVRGWNGGCEIDSEYVWAVGYVEQLWRPVGGGRWKMLTDGGWYV